MLHQLTQNTKLLQKAILLTDNQVLLLKRSQTSQTRPGKWDLPGGNSEWPNALDNITNPHELDLLREIKEETNLKVGSYWQERHQPLYFTTYFESKKQVFSVIVIWLIPVQEEVKSLVSLSHEHEDFQWAELNRLSEFDFGFAGEPGGFIYEAFKRLNDLSF